MVAVVVCGLGFGLMAPAPVYAQPAGPAITVTPSTDLVDGQTVVVDGSGFSADWPAVAIDQCSITPFVCGVEVILYEAGESFSTPLTLERFVDGVDCSLTPGNCAIVAANFDPVGGALGEIVISPLTFATAPGTPSIGAALAGDGSATVSWTAPVTDGGAAITGYVVTPYVGYSPRPSTTFDSTATTQVVTGLTNGTQYRFRVRAINAVGTGGYSTVTNPVTPKARHTLYINMESIGAAGGGSLVSLDPAIPAAACSVAAGSRRQCQYSVEEGEDLVLQAILDDEGNQIEWGVSGCASVFGDHDDKCLIFMLEENLSVDVFFVVP